MTESDYNEEGLQDLLTEYGSAYDINLGVFRHLQRTITGWARRQTGRQKAAGRCDSSSRFHFPKRVLVFSPHPDDDVISMGGTIIRLAEQGHTVHIAYQTSGNIAVFDDDTLRAVEFVSDYCDEFKVQSEQIHELEQHVDEFLRNKKVGPSR